MLDAMQLPDDFCSSDINDPHLQRHFQVAIFPHVSRGHLNCLKHGTSYLCAMARPALFLAAH